MNNEKFKQLILDAYKKCKNGHLAGIIYGATFTHGFSEIIDINGFVNTIPVDMLYLKSKVTDTEIDIYSYDLVDYKIKNSEETIYIKLRNKEVAIMY